MMEGSRVVWKGETDKPGTVDEVTQFWADDPDVYLVTFDDGQFGIFDRSELMETNL